MLTEPARALLFLAGVLERLQIPYAVGGSVASSLFGEYRATNDIDVVVDLGLRDVHALVDGLAADCAVDGESARTAVKEGRAFQAFHTSQFVKFDLYVAGEDRMAMLQIARRRREPVGAGESETVWFSSPEDVVLRKLEWYHRSGGVLSHQLNDVRGVLQVQAASLDIPYLRIQAAQFGLTPLLERALRDAGMGPAQP